MDELLDSRVKQLKYIDEELEKILPRIVTTPGESWHRVNNLRLEILTMIGRAEREYREF